MKNFTSPHLTSPHLTSPHLTSLRRIIFLLLLFQFNNQISTAQPSDFKMECGTDQSVTVPQTDLDANPLAICTDPNAVKYIRVAFHFILAEGIVSKTVPLPCPVDTLFYVGSGNFTETSDGDGNSGYNGFQRSEEIVNLANYELANNKKQWRPNPNSYYPPIPPANPIRYILVGTYFHRDNAAFTGQLTRAQIHNKYDVGGESVLDAYSVLYTHVTWTGNASAVGGQDKYFFTNDYAFYLSPNLPCREWSVQFDAQNFNHECGHTLNLIHTWDSDDLCDDTQKGYIYDKVENDASCTMDQYANCWTMNGTIPGCPRKPCDDWGKVSDNIMDYNQEFPHAYTTCQISRIQTELLYDGNPYIHSCNGCKPSNAFFFMRDHYPVCSDGQYTVILNGQGSFNENRWLIEICEVDPATPDVCTVNYYSSGWQTGTLDLLDLATMYSFAPNKHYKVKLTVDNVDCPGSSSWEKNIETYSCTVTDPPIELQAVNPFNEQLSVYYHAPAEGELNLNLVNLLTGQSVTLISGEQMDEGYGVRNFNTASLPAGNYSLIASFNGVQSSENLLKIQP